MTNINETNTFPANVQRYDSSDPVLGGLSGESNLPLIGLASRTRYLYNAINGFDGVTTVTATGNITTAHLRKMVLINISTNIALTIAAGSGFIVGQRLSFMVKTSIVKCVQFLLSGGDTFLNLPSPFTGLWLHDGEEIGLVWTGSGWWIEDINTNLKMVGNDALVRRLPRNTVAAHGTEIIRVDYARLWDAVSGAAVSQAAWNTSAPQNQGFFSSGNGSSTLRLPDMRSMSWRGLDNNRGISLARNTNTAGGYEADGNRSHNHINGEYNSLLKVDGTQTARDVDNSATEPNVVVSGLMLASGNTEATVKNIGLSPVIYY